MYQIKKLKLKSISEADALISEVSANFDQERIRDGNVILVIDDASLEIRQYLINMKIQSLRKVDLTQMAAGFDEAEDRQKVLRIVYEEFCRDYAGFA